MSNNLEQSCTTDVAIAVNSLRNICHNASSDAGWWTAKDGSPLQDNPYAFSNKLMLTVSELAEAVEGDRKGTMDDHLPDRPMREVELADALIRLLDLAGAYNLDLGGAFVAKMKYNSSRKDHRKESREADGGKKY